MRFICWGVDLRSVIFSICSLVITFAARAQTLTVVENGTARPLEGVQVFSKSTGPVGSTDANGQVTILTDARSDTLVFTALGYRAEQLTWNELAQQGYRVVLVVAPFQLPEVVISANRW